MTVRRCFLRQTLFSSPFEIEIIFACEKEVKFHFRFKINLSQMDLRKELNERVVKKSLCNTFSHKIVNEAILNPTELKKINFNESFIRFMTCCGLILV